MARKKINLLIVVLATFSFAASAQKVMPYFKIIGGTCDMGELKKYQDLKAAQYTTNGSPTKVTSKFPYALQFEVGIEFKAKHFSFGPWVAYSEAKGTLAYRDNASSTTIKHSVMRLSVGFKMSKYVYKNFGVYAKPGLNASTLTIKASKPINRDDDYQSDGGTFELGCLWKYSFNRIQVSTNLGYEMGIYSRLEDRDGSAYELTNTQDEPVHVNWNGLRLGIGLAFSFGRKHKAFTPKTIEIE